MNIFFINTSEAIPADFKYVLINSRVATDNHLTIQEIMAIRVYRLMKSIGVSAMDDFGLDTTNSIEEKIPNNIAKVEEIVITRNN